MLGLGLAFLCTLSFVMSMVAGISHKCINSHFNQCTWLFSCALDYSDFHICLISIFFFFMLSDSWYLKVGELIVNSHFFFFSFFLFFSCYQIRGTWKWVNRLLILLIYTPKWKEDLQVLKTWQLCSWKIISIVFSSLKRKALSFPFFSCYQ